MIIWNTNTSHNYLSIDRSIKLSCMTYITKILESHNWLRPTQKSPIKIPMNHDKNYMNELENAVGPIEFII